MPKSRFWRLLSGLLLVSFLTAGLAACRGGDEAPIAEDVTFEVVAFEPDTFVVGDVTVIIKVLRAGTPLANARVDAQGDMSHAGMVPVQASGTTGADGQVRLPLEWTMAGDWTITVTITTPEGQKRAGQFELVIN
ncbi:MAG: FixH family protein [Chloroflexi bacterium]|nr:FixH family protein [Chloroflexota bacterium]